jgi:hypothetical protein
MGNKGGMDAHRRFVERIATEQDEVLATLQLVGQEHDLTDRLFDQLVDLMVESLFLGLRQEYLDGQLTRERYAEELRVLADRCRAAGLLPLPTRSV